ncbi:CHAP domain-containing protein [Candidatus Saccharibacteria bacterium]|nr:MAG: CHAP domain-containing protein [Candidatus Saccharibacteria bacterium]
MKLMKPRSTTPVFKGLATKSLLVAGAVLMALSTPMVFSSRVLADKWDDQINAINAEINNLQAQAAVIAEQSRTLANALAALTAQRQTIQAQVDLSQAKYDKLVNDIAETEKQIADNKDALGQIIADMYVDGSISPLELLASASNISDYVDQQEYRSSIQTNLSDTIARINELKKQLEAQKADVERVLADQKSQRDALAAKEAEQAKLLSDSQGQESVYQSMIGDRNAQINSLKDQQQAEIRARLQQFGGGGSAVAGDPGRGGYPNYLANAYQDSLVDPWGMYNRECVSYVAWKVFQKNGYMPYWGGVGNANQWPGNARAAGITTSSTPRAGSAGVITAGYYGHIVWVDSVNSDGTINISQYNEWLPGLGWGYYSERYNVSPYAYNVYIYF